MELFKLFGTIALKNDEANRGIDQTSDKAKDAQKDIKDFGDEGGKTESKLGKAFSKIGSAAAKVGKTIGVGMVAAGAAVVAVGKKALDSYADYEQLVGGVETLFKDNADIVTKNAAKAYKSAGLSANEYMETVTSFSASLLQSLGGDTKAAAEKADMAIVDMSDNANKMGTSMEAIQNAYQGFAKQNYTMLDNLKLGYGGTKEEMQRLLDDAEKLSGIKYDISSYSDIVDAIHVVQTEMHISGLTAEEAAEKVKKGEMTQEEAFEAMGTTAKEASTTIQGSVQSMKSAWQNLITGIADENANLDELVNNFFNSIVTVGENVIPRIGVILNGINLLIQKLAPKIIAALPGIFNQVLPMVVSGAQNLLTAVVNVLPQFGKLIMDILPSLLTAVKSLFMKIVEKLPDFAKLIAESLPSLIPQVVSSIIEMAVYLMKHIGEILQPIIDNLPSILDSLVTSLMDNLPILIDGVISLVMGLVRATPQIIISLLQSLPTIIEKVISGLLECLPQLIEGLILLNIELVAHLPEIILELIQAIPRIISSIGNAIIQAGPKLFSAFGEIFGKCWEKLQEAFSGIGEWFSNLVGAIRQKAIEWYVKVKVFFQNIWNTITGIFSKVGEWFSNIFNELRNKALVMYAKITSFFQNIWNSITGIFSKIGEWFGNIFSSAVEHIKGAFNGVKQFFTDLGQNIWSAIKTPINWIIGGINAIIDGLNSIHVEIPSWIPGIGGKTFGFSLNHIAELAEGGIVDDPTPAVIGEAGAEAVVPLENNTGWITKLAKQIHQISMTDTDTAKTLSTNGRFITAIKSEIGDRIKNLETVVTKILAELQDFFPDFLEAFDVQLVLDDGTLVAELTPKIDRELGKIKKRKERG